MIVQPITKKTLKFIRQLNQKKYRRESGLFVISGLRAVTQALEAKSLKVKFILIEKKRAALINQLPAVECDALYGLGPAEFAYISDEKKPQGIALVVHRPQYSINNLVWPQSLIYLEQISDAGNLGTIMRSVLWFGWPVLLLGHRAVDPFQPKVVRASAGTITRLKIVENVGLEKIAQLKNEGHYKIVGTTVQKGFPLPAFKRMNAKNLLLAFGSEAHGLSAELSQLCDVTVTIPKAGEGESLNLAIALSLFLYQLFAVHFSASREEGHHE